MLIIQALGSANKRTKAKAVAAKGKKKKTVASDAPKEEFKHTGNLTMDQVGKIAKELISMGKFRQNKVLQAMLSVVGTASTMSCTVDNKTCKEVTQILKDGGYKIPVA